MRLYYMTSAHWAEVILTERRLKLSRFFEANDPFELNLIDARDPERRSIVRMIEEHHNSKTGMICLGPTWDNPMMWAHYADKHKGVCLGLEVDDSLLSVVTYTDEKIAVDLGPHLPDHGLSAELLDRVIRTKSMVWLAEQERRIFAPLKTPDPRNGLYYSDFGPQVQLRAVAIGYRCAWTISKAVGLLADVTHPVRVWKVRPAFGRFAMVEQHQVKAVTVRPAKTSSRRKATLPRTGQQK